MQSLANYYVRMAMARVLDDSYELKPMYEKIYEFIIEYVKQHGTRRGAFAEAARTFYPHIYDKDPRYATNIVHKLFKYSLLKRLSPTNGSPTSPTDYSPTDGLDATLENPEKYDLGYIVEQSRPLHRRRSRFREDMELPREVFEFKKLLIAMVREIYSGRLQDRAVDLVHTLVRDKRVLDLIRGRRIWYNGRSYVKLDEESAALAYITLLKIHMNLYGVSQQPKKLVAIFTAYTSYSLKDIEHELQKLSSTFYDWLLLLN